MIQVLYNRRGVSDYALYDEAGIEERTGVAPKLYTQYAALRGDPSDNLPGVPGVGEKTAAKLINTYGGIDGIFEHVDEQTPKLRASLAEHEAKVRSNADVMVLLRDIPLEIAPDGLRLEPFDREEVRKLFDFLEFRTLHERLGRGVRRGGGRDRDTGHRRARGRGRDDRRRRRTPRSFLDGFAVERQRRATGDREPPGTDRRDAARCSASRSCATRRTPTRSGSRGPCSTTTACRDVVAGAHRRRRPSRSPRTASSR